MLPVELERRAGKGGIKILLGTLKCEVQQQRCGAGDVNISGRYNNGFFVKPAARSRLRGSACFIQVITLPSLLWSSLWVSLTHYPHLYCTCCESTPFKKQPGLKVMPAAQDATSKVTLVGSGSQPLNCCNPWECLQGK